MRRRDFVKVIVMDGGHAAEAPHLRDRIWLKTYDTHRWMEEKGITEHHVSCLETDWTLQ